MYGEAGGDSACLPVAPWACRLTCFPSGARPPLLQPPVLEYAYRVVKNEPCDTTAIMGSENPSCLMTAAQLVARRGDYLETGAYSSGEGRKTGQSKVGEKAKKKRQRTTHEACAAALPLFRPQEA